MAGELQFDVSDLVHASRAIYKLPGEIKAKAFARAMRRMGTMTKTRVVRRGAERVSIPQKFVRDITTATFNAGGNTVDIIERSNWISLYKLGATQTSRGVRVRARGSYKHAFIAEMNSGHRGVMRRVGDKRLPIRELFGPNPAHDVTNNPQEYLEVLAEVIQDHLLPRFVHELDRILPR